MSAGLIIRDPRSAARPSVAACVSRSAHPIRTTGLISWRRRSLRELQAWSGQRVLFIDRDGTIITEPADKQIDSLQKFRLVPDVIAGLQRLRDAGYTLVMVSNQDGLGTESFPEPTFREPHEFLRELLKTQGITFAEEFICPHKPADNCQCRKPKTRPARRLP